MMKLLNQLRAKLALAAAHDDPDVADWATRAMADLNRIRREMPAAFKGSIAEPAADAPGPPPVVAPAQEQQPSVEKLETQQRAPQAAPGLPKDKPDVQALIAIARQAVARAGG